jgi:hypothetical protein
MRRRGTRRYRRLAAVAAQHDDIIARGEKGIKTVGLDRKCFYLRCRTDDRGHSDRIDRGVIPIVDNNSSIMYPAYEGDTASGIEDENIEKRLVDLGYL